MKNLNAILPFQSFYRNLAYVRSLANGQVSDGELGVDRPEDVARLYEGELAWLNED